MGSRDPVFKSERMSRRDLANMAGMPWTACSPQVVNGRRCMVLGLEGMRVRVVVADGAVHMDGAEHAVDYVLFWIRS